MSEYGPLLLPENHRTTQYVRQVAARIVEANGLGRMKGAKPSGLDSSMGGWGAGEVESWKEGEREEVEWEVCLLHWDLSVLSEVAEWAYVGVCDQRQEYEECFRPSRSANLLPKLYTPLFVED